MARKSAAQLAQEEAELAAKKLEAGNDGSEIGSDGTQGGDDGTQNGDDGAHTGDDGSHTGDAPAVEIEKGNAVALRDLPGTPAKIGQIILAPKNLIDSWEQVAWVDSHENAIAFALKKVREQNIANPHNQVIEEMELDYAGQLVVKVLEE